MFYSQFIHESAAISLSKVRNSETFQTNSKGGRGHDEFHCCRIEETFVLLYNALNVAATKRVFEVYNLRITMNSIYTFLSLQSKSALCVEDTLT
jgi:hypothetical protein